MDIADQVAFNHMLEEWRREGEATGLMRIKQTELMSEGTHLKIYEEHPDVSGLDSVKQGLVIMSVRGRGTRRFSRDKVERQS